MSPLRGWEIFLFTSPQVIAELRARSVERILCGSSGAREIILLFTRVKTRYKYVTPTGWEILLLQPCSPIMRLQAHPNVAEVARQFG